MDWVVYLNQFLQEVNALRFYRHLVWTKDARAQWSQCQVELWLFLRHFYDIKLIL